MTEEERLDYLANIRAAQAESLGLAEVLIEALPWIKQSTGKTMVIKYGGAAMIDDVLRADVMSDIVLMKIIGIKPIIVHGGGNDISVLSKRLGLPVAFKDGMRVSPPEVMEIVKMVLLGKVNQELVAQLNAHGHLAVGLNGADGHIMKAKKTSDELGMVGTITNVDTTLLNDLINHDYVPVIASVAVGEDGLAYNVNADLAAGEIAAAVGAHKVIFLTDVDGLYSDFEDKSSLIFRLSLTEAEQMMASLSSGMLPKIEACIKALKSGVSRAHILNGTIPHSLLLEIFTNEGVGTMIMADDDEYSPEEFRVATVNSLAQKLHMGD
ncbi:MAG: acetylglutamate kinase [Coriobacteriales bacterium]|jgi:acetylglutamate kinase|nr:acetylglutamate kinase [Coriobacteriales bacterium]